MGGCPSGRRPVQAPPDIQARKYGCAITCAGARAMADRQQLALAEAGLFHEPHVEVVEAARHLLALLLGLLRIPKKYAALRAVGKPREANAGTSIN